MFGWGRKKKEAAVVEFVVDRMAPMFKLLASRLDDGPPRLALDEELPPRLLGDPYFVGFVSVAVSIFVNVSSKWKASFELKGLASYSAFRLAFPSEVSSLASMSEIVQRARGAPECLAGARAADVILGVCFGAIGEDEPEVVAARIAVAKMPESIREMMVARTDNDLLIYELMEELFYRPLIRKHKAA